MRLPLIVVTRAAVHNLLMEHGLRVAVPTGCEAGDPTIQPGDVPALLKRILEAHQRRVEQYCSFQSDFDALLATNDLAAYSTRCAQVAAALNDVSAEVNAAGASLRTVGREDLSDTAAALQQHEKEHLRLVATLQVLRKEHAAGRWSWQQAEVSLEGVDPSAVRPQWAIDRSCRAHVDGQAGGAEAAASAGCQCGAAEPTREEYEGAVREATQALQRTMLAIDDVLGELREAASEE